MASAEGSFGHHIDKSLVDQIKVREKVFGKGFKGAAKTDTELKYIHGNVPWIILRSSVNTGATTVFPVAGGTSTNNNDLVNTYLNQAKQPVSPVISKTTKTVGSPKDAKVYTLVGGQIGNRAGIEGWTVGNPAYRDDVSFGFRPIPGITGAKVRTKDTWGMILEAEISLEIWSRDDLEVIDKLYFRPGMTALLEWGHSAYFDNSGAEKVAGPSSIVPNSVFFSANNFTGIENEVNSCRKKGQGNYEGMFGYITNFSWSFNKNGSYSATVKLLSRGAVLEGLQVQAPKHRNGITGDQDGTTSIYHQAFNYIDKSLSDSSKRNQLQESVKYGDIMTFYNVYERDVKIKRSMVFDSFAIDTTVPMIYIKFRDFLRLTELQCGLWEENGDASSDNNRYPKFDYVTKYKYLSFAEHFSLNPYVAYIPHIASVVNGVGISGFSFIDKKYDYNNIGDISISLNFIKDTVSTMIDQGTSFKVKDLIETILSEIQKAFGNVNDFALYYNPCTELWAVVDHNNPSDPGDENGTEWTKPERRLSITGVSTTVRELKVTSEVSADLANEMSIAATANNSAAHPSLVHWNDTLYNRHVSPSRDDSPDVRGPMLPQSYGIEYSSEAYEDFYEKVKVFYRQFKTRIEEEGPEVSQFSLDRFSEIQVAGEEIFKRFLQLHSLPNNSTEKRLQMGIIPIKVELTLMGIGRFVVGTSFMVNGQGGTCILPKQYQDWGWIITGVEHNISTSEWTTSLRTQYYPVLQQSTSVI